MRRARSGGFLGCSTPGGRRAADVERTILALPMLCAEGATVIWTRHRRPPDARNDPPYFVWVIQLTASQDADALAVYLLSGAMGAVDPAHFANDPTWKAVTVGGKEAQVGSAKLVDQSEH
jgi:hypothetical protein